ncbi:related to BEM46 family protein [Saccharomycodes ludwigii]|uniref:Related to BEM46 family protein n=1 Tax=Saccharomycodes ludwigii TaxID=36035 RepID=A0A376B546_9ASCO|nr:hypothetical protein SCDLUD_005005 [Saccharomycodes ludwigii]KAH3898682.1 hypothetical protein SCDLUD_005005 [Saccharomycodes ludwigii]SSD59709.1 related to BEM46 family protein [Saccharomycodes ludwigii]
MLFKTAIKMLLGGGLATFSIAVSILYFNQNKLIYPSWANNSRKFVDLPSSFDLPFEEDIKLITEDGIQLQAFDIRNPKSKSTLLILTPNAGNIGHFLPLVKYLYDNFNLSIFIYSYRGYGLSQGTPNEAGLKLDADRIMKYLTQESDFHKNRKLVLYGRSIGGAVSIYIASKYPQYIDGIILENTFLSIRKVIPYIFPFLKYFTFLCHEVWNSEYEITKINDKVPILFLNGIKDEIVPPSHSIKLFELCPSEKKYLKRFPLGHHNDTIVQDGYWDHVYDFLVKFNLI